MLASNWRALRKKVEYLFTEHSYIDHCTYLGFGLLEAPREHVLHGPLLGMYWLRLCPHFGAPTLEATLLRRRLFIFLMTAAPISPTSFPSNCPLLAYWASYFNTITHAYILYITFTFTHLILCYNILHSAHMSILHLHFFHTTWLLLIHYVRYNFCIVCLLGYYWCTWWYFWWQNIVYMIIFLHSTFSKILLIYMIMFPYQELYSDGGM